MKKSILLIIIFLGLINQNCLGQVYQLSENYEALYYEKPTTVVLKISQKSDYNDNIKSLKEGTMVNKISEIDGLYVVEVLEYKNNDIQNKELFNTSYDRKTSKANLSYLIDKSKLIEVKSRWGFGTLLVPIKIRFEGGKEEDNTKRYTNFSSGFNLGLTLSMRVFKKMHKNNLYFLTALSSSQIKIDAETTNNKVTSAQDNFALTPTIGFLIDFEGGFQITFLIGIDYLSGKIGREWVYKDKPFLGIGMGFEIMKFGEKPKKN